MQSDAQKLLVATIKKLLHRHGKPQLVRIIQRSHPADLAYAFSFLTDGERLELFTLIEDLELAARLLSELEPRILSSFLRQLEDRKLAQVFEAMSSDDTADLLELIDDEDRRELLMTMMRRDDLATTQALLEHDPESAGGLMVPDFFALEETTTAGEGVRRLQEDAGQTEMVFYIYVVNEHGHLVGVTSLRELVLAPRQRLLKSFMTPEVIRVAVDTDQEEVARLIARYNLVALPVVDEGNHLVGVITVDDIIDVMRLEATEDMMLMAGAGESQMDDYGSGLVNFRRRAPWLAPTLVGGLLAMLTLWWFEQEIALVLPLVGFIPLLMSLADNVSAQSSTIVTRGLALGRTDFVQASRVFFSELGAGALVGLSAGLVCGALAYALLRAHPHMIAVGPLRFVAASAALLALCMPLASLAGAFMPLGFARFKLDPAIATGALVTTAVDLGVVLLYLGGMKLALGL